MSIETLSMHDLHEKLSQLSADELILDVRRPDEFQTAHIRGARNIPHEQVAQFASDLKKYKKIYIHCQAGRRAQVATQTLSQLGLTNLACIGNSGMGDWIAAGYPTE
ncbi:MAG: rhodanese-like domain-containing protein [Bdellovibrionia bacterium]